MAKSDLKKKYLIAIVPWHENTPLNSAHLIEACNSWANVNFQITYESEVIAAIRDYNPSLSGTTAVKVEESLLRLLRELPPEKSEFIYQRLTSGSITLESAQRDWLRKLWKKYNLGHSGVTLDAWSYSVYFFDDDKDGKIWSKTKFEYVVIPKAFLSLHRPKVHDLKRGASVRKTLSTWPKKVVADLLKQESDLVNFMREPGFMLEQRVIDF